MKCDVKKKERIKMTFLIDPSVKTKVKLKAAKSGVQISYYIEKLIRNDLKAK